MITPKSTYNKITNMVRYIVLKE